MVYDLSKAFDTGDTDYLANKFSLNQEQLKRIAEFIPNINWLGEIKLIVKLQFMYYKICHFI